MLCLKKKLYFAMPLQGIALYVGTYYSSQLNCIIISRKQRFNVIKQLAAVDLDCATRQKDELKTAPFLLLMSYCLLLRFRKV